MDAKISTKTNTLAKGLIEKNVSFIEETTSKIAQKKRRAIDEKINEMKLVESYISVLRVFKCQVKFQMKILSQVNR